MRSLIFLGTILLLYSSSSFRISKVISTAIEIHCCITALVTNLPLLVIVVAKHIVMPMPKFKRWRTSPGPEVIGLKYLLCSDNACFNLFFENHEHHSLGHLWRKTESNKMGGAR